MSYPKVSNLVKAVALLSFVAIAFEYWSAGAFGLALLLSPYAVIYFLSSENNYRDLKLTLIRITPAIFSFILVVWLLFGIEPDPQAGIGLMLGVVAQLALISVSELIVFLFINDEYSA